MTKRRGLFDFDIFLKKIPNAEQQKVKLSFFPQIRPDNMKVLYHMIPNGIGGDIETIGNFLITKSFVPVEFKYQLSLFGKPLDGFPDQSFDQVEVI
jgi:hypothetical protein